MGVAVSAEFMAEDRERGMTHGEGGIRCHRSEERSMGIRLEAQDSSESLVVVFRRFRRRAQVEAIKINHTFGGPLVHVRTSFVAPVVPSDELSVVLVHGSRRS